jgi:hypothetical protein
MTQIAAPCGQCGKPNVVSVGAVLLCVDCWHKFQVARTLDFRLYVFSNQPCPPTCDPAARSFSATAARARSTATPRCGIITFARALMRRTEAGKAYGAITSKARRSP